MKKNVFPYRESNPGRLGENQESLVFGQATWSLDKPLVVWAIILLKVDVI